MSSTGAAELYRRTYGREPDGVFSAPGRVNLIGEHTDYNGGLVLPFAIDARAYLAAGLADRGTVRVASAQKPGEITTVPLDDIQPGSPAVAGWPGYLLGAFWSLGQSHHPIEPVNLALDSQAPAGAGLSSSAAVECAAVLAISRLAGHKLKPLKVARLAQRVENGFVGVPCGPMDQTASAACQTGSVLLFDTRSEDIDNIPFDPAAHGLTVLVVDTRVAHSLADGEYGKRGPPVKGQPQFWMSSSCGTSPSMACPRNWAGCPTTNCDAACGTWSPRTTGWPAPSSCFGKVGSPTSATCSPPHTSLRDDYDVSCPELDHAVDTALAAGALGARMTGGGFGGEQCLKPVDGPMRASCRL
jgi:galactokinase